MFEKITNDNVMMFALKYYNNPQCEGLLAVCLQHEMDHLQGKLFVDYLSPLKRQRIRQRLEKEQRRRA